MKYSSLQGKKNPSENILHTGKTNQKRQWLFKLTFLKEFILCTHWSTVNQKACLCLIKQANKTQLR